MIDLSEYMRVNIRVLIRQAIQASRKDPRELFFLLRYAKASRRAYRKREALEKQGKHVPPFLIASITQDCNLRCKGCYSLENSACRSAGSQMTGERWKEIFAQAADIGVCFILLAGGEPMMRMDVLRQAARTPDILFPVFTNGTLIGDEAMELFSKNRCLVPVLSLEGDETMTDERRGAGTFAALTGVMERLRAAHVFFCASVTVTRENLQYVTGKAFIDGLTVHGVKLVFYVEYVPVDEKTRCLALGDAEREALDGALDGLRLAYKNVIFISFPGDEKLTGGCLAAGRGFFHISPTGDAEPCPFSPYSDLNLKDHSLLEALDSPLFKELNKEEYLLQEHEGGCLLFEKREEVQGFLKREPVNG